MADLKKAIGLISGSTPTQEQMNRVSAIAHALDIANNDAMLPILIALDTYHGVFSNWPKKSAEEASRMAAWSANEAKAGIDRAIAGAIQTMAPTAAKALENIAADVAGKEKVIWVAVSIAVAAMFLCLFGLFINNNGFQNGFSAGKESGYSAARQEKATAAWANTPEGKLAFQLAQAGSITALATCDEARGWVLNSHNVCHVKRTKTGVDYGWKIK